MEVRRVLFLLTEASGAAPGQKRKKGGGMTEAPGSRPPMSPPPTSPPALAQYKKVPQTPPGFSIDTPPPPAALRWARPVGAEDGPGAPVALEDGGLARPAVAAPVGGLSFVLGLCAHRVVRVLPRDLRRRRDGPFAVVVAGRVAAERDQAVDLRLVEGLER